ncbi:MAG: serine hydrolase [Planctomycetales bacterium]|nr:serine hydrolase [Planctomycetales bacterium]
MHRSIRIGLCALLLGTQLGAAEHTQDKQLHQAIEPLVREHAGEVGLAIESLSSDVSYHWQADRTMPTASLIKLPLLVATYQQADAGTIDLAQRIALREEDKVPGSGILTGHFSSGAEFPLRDYVRLMIRYSDNAATNVVAEAIGLGTTTKSMANLGLRETQLHSKVYRRDTSIAPERSQKYGIGSTSAKEMVQLLIKLERGELASPDSTTAMRNHLLSCDDDTKIAGGLPRQVRFAHKTGAIANCRTDAGIIYTKSGPVAVCLLTNNNEDQSWQADNAAHKLASRIGRIIAERFGSPEDDDQLREGAFGKIVESLQRTLNDRLSPSPDLAIDGDFGPATRGAVEQLQRAHLLEVTGAMNRQTWRVLGPLIETDEPVPAPEEVNAAQFARSPQADPTGPPIVTARAWVVVNAKSREILFEANSSLPRPPASTTKIMTAYLVTRYASAHPEALDEIVTFSTRADDTPGSTSGLRAGEQVTVRELLYGLLLPSGNDASVAFAEHFGPRLVPGDAVTEGDTDEASAYDSFVDAMNAAARDLGLTHTHFVNPHGLSADEHFASAADLARLGLAAIENELFRSIVSTRQFGCTTRSTSGYQRNVLWKNTNELLEIEGYSGIKTGTTSDAGACLVGMGERNNDKLLVVILGSSSSPARYADIRNLFQWAWRTRNTQP